MNARTTAILVLASALWTAAVLQLTWDNPGRSALSQPAVQDSVEFTSDRPVPSQESIDEALTRFGIKLPSNVMGPMYDPDLLDRGLTSRSNWTEAPSVRIGPSAFTSWALLGSTLAHELEVHCNQSFFRIALEEQFGLEGTARAEREAYTFELVNYQRFGLSGMERRLIMETMDRYYPADGAARNPTLTAMRMGIGSILSR